MTINEWLKDNSLGIDIWNNKYRYNNESLDEWFERISNHNPLLKQRIIEKKFLFGGRTLANRGTNNGSYSNCYCMGRVSDDLKEILSVNSEIALTFKAQGGQGLSLSNIRPKGAKIGTNFESDGIIPFMEMYNTTTGSISQGSHRRGALMMSIDVEHPQAKDFITIKSDLNKINNANLSVEIGDRFMQAVQEFYSTGKIVTYTVENRFKGGNPDGYQITPIHLYKLIMESAWKSAEPGVMFMNRFSNYNLMEYVPNYQIYTSNPCGEQPLPKYGACNLASINLSEYVLNPFSADATLNESELIKDIKIYVEAMDIIVDENSKFHALPQQREFSQNYRNIGIGVMGIADMFIKLNLQYGSSESKQLLKHLMPLIFREAVIASSQLAKTKGSFPKYDERIWDSTIIQKHFNSAEISELRKNGLRNSSLLSIAPTGSIGTMLGVSTGCEPFFALEYNRRTVSLHKDQEVSYKVNIPVVQEYFDYCDKHNQAITSSILVTSADINWKDRIEIQQVLQDSIDTAISSTINLPENTTVDEIEQLYLYAWSKGLKGVTIYRNNSRKSILSTNDNISTVNNTTKKKRPKELNAKVIHFKNGNENWIAFVGLLNDRPYEIFTGVRDIEEFPIPTSVSEGKIIKTKENGVSHYDFQYLDKYGYVNVIGGLSRVFCQEYWNYAKLLSALLRFEIPLLKVIKLIEGMTFESASLNNWRDGIKRILKSFIQDGIDSGNICPECKKGHLIYEGGCTICHSCGHSACG